jgi:TolB-like protein
VSAFRRFSETISGYDGISREIRGDALIAQFSKASDAVSASLAFQAANAAHNEELPDDFRPVVRIGIAMGEVVVADNTVTGEGVVLAQRLEQLAEPGCVCLQGATYETVPQRMPFEYRNLGKREVKGFDDPVRVYEAKLKLGAAVPAPTTTAQQKPVVSEGSGKPSIAVLPFDNMSGDPEQEYFSDGICEDIITGLSRYRELVVIARGSSFVFKGQSVDITEAAGQLGCQYVLEGSVRKAGDRVRITAQLIDGATGSHLWAEKYDRVLEDVFAVQDDVVSTIVSTIAGRLDKESRERAARKSPANLTAYEHVLLGKYYWPDGLGSQEDRDKARDEFNKAVEFDPECVPAYTGLAWAYLSDFWYETPTDQLGTLAFDYARRAVELDDSDAFAHLMLAYAYIDVKSDLELGRVQLERAVELNPNDYNNACAQISVGIRTGNYKESVACANEAIRLNPFLPDFCLSECGFAEFFAKQYDKALKTFGRMLAPGLNVRGCIAVCYAQLGRDEEARIAAAACRDEAKEELGSDWGIESWQNYWDEEVFGWFAQGPETNDRLRDGLQKAGLP